MSDRTRKALFVTFTMRYSSVFFPRFVRISIYHLLQYSFGLLQLQDRNQSMMQYSLDPFHVSGRL